MCCYLGDATMTWFVIEWSRVPRACHTTRWGCCWYIHQHTSHPPLSFFSFCSAGQMDHLRQAKADLEAKAEGGAQAAKRHKP